MEEENKSELTENKKESAEGDTSRYKNFSSPKNRKLELGLWLIENKKRLRAALIIFLVMVAAVSWAYTIYGFAYYIARGMNEDEALIRQMVEIETIGHDYITKIAAQDLIYFPVKILRAKEDEYDFITQVKNPNLKHWVDFNYCFEKQGEEIECGNGFVLPGETKNLLSLAQTFTRRPTDVSFLIKNISWRRLSLRRFPSWENFRDEHLNISIIEEKFKPAQTSGLSEKLNLNSLKFKATNKTPYNYWEVPLIILLSSGNSLVGINKYTLTEFMSGEEREVEMSWLGNLSRVNNIKIIPEINILGDDIYIRYEGGIGEEK